MRRLTCIYIPCRTPFAAVVVVAAAAAQTSVELTAVEERSDSSRIHRVVVVVVVEGMVDHSVSQPGDPRENKRILNVL